MNNNKMITTAKHLDTFVKVAGTIFRVFGILSIVFAILTLFLGTKMTTENSVTLGFVKLYLSDQFSIHSNLLRIYLVLGLLIVSILCFLTDHATKIVRKILSPIKDGRPFERDIPENLRKIAWIVLIGGSVSQIIGIVENVILSRACPIDQLIVPDAITKLEYTFTMDFGFVLIFMILMFLSYIFSYGQILQQESDETL